jgi:transcriptional regulator with XRE-family HTH domain
LRHNKRHEAGWSRDEIATLTGVSANTVRTWLELREPHHPNVSAAKILAAALADHAKKSE